MVRFTLLRKKNMRHVPKIAVVVLSWTVPRKGLLRNVKIPNEFISNVNDYRENDTVITATSSSYDPFGDSHDSEHSFDNTNLRFFDIANENIDITSVSSNKTHGKNRSFSVSNLHHESDSYDDINNIMFRKRTSQGIPWKENLTTHENDSLKLSILSQNVCGLKDDSKLEYIIDKMKEREISIALLQETWLIGDFSKTINGFQMIHHGLKKMSSNRGERGVAIILSPSIIDAYKSAGESPPLTPSDLEDTCYGRFISINICLKCHFNCSKGAFRKKRQKHLNVNISIASIYYPVDYDEHEEIIEFVEQKISELPKLNKIIIGQDSNAKVGISKPLESDTIRDPTVGYYGDSSFNTKGENLANSTRSMNLKIANTWFPHVVYTTWRDFSSRCQKHQIDHFLIDQCIFESTDDCKVTSIGVASGYSGLILKLSIKCDKKKHKCNSGYTKWDSLIDIEKRKKFNDSLKDLTSDDCNLSDFCNALCKAGKLTLGGSDPDNTGWYDSNQDLLRP